MDVKDLRKGALFTDIYKVDLLDKSFIDGNFVFNVYPAMCCHYFGSEKIEDKSYVVLGTCGKPSILSDLSSYDTFVYENSSASDWFYGNNRNFLGYVCLLDANCESLKLSDAIKFVPMIAEYFYFDETAKHYPREAATILRNINQQFNNTMLGELITDIKKNETYLKGFTNGARCTHGNVYVMSAMQRFIPREKVIAQILCKYDLKSANDFEKSILVNLYDNAENMMKTFMRLKAEEIGVKDFDNLFSDKKHKILNIVGTMPFTKKVEYCENKIELLKEQRKKEIEEEKSSELLKEKDRIKKRISKIRI